MADPIAKDRERAGKLHTNLVAVLWRSAYIDTDRELIARAFADLREECAGIAKRTTLLAVECDTEGTAYAEGWDHCMAHIARRILEGEP